MPMANAQKNNKDIYYSLGLHLVIMVIFSIGLGFAPNHKARMNQPIIVDLSEVKISTKTNLPPKIEAVAKKQKTIKKEAKKETKKPAQTFTKPKSTAAPKTKQDTKSSDIKLSDMIKKTAKKSVPKKDSASAKKSKTKAKNQDSSSQLSSLLASVEKLKPNQTTSNHPETAVDKLAENISSQGIKGGIGGDYNLEISISEKDAIASKLRACWNIDAGAKGVLDMQVAIKAFLDKNGKVVDVKIIDMGRYSSDKSFRAIADSARRAVYVCDKKGEDSPFKILAKIYPGQFNVWQELHLQFNPLDGGVF